jgi:FkbM family methyltransferase
MNFLKKRLKQAIRRLGLDVVIHRPFLELTSEWGITTVLDVGANIGQFAAELRESGYGGVIYSFEPTAEAFAALKQNAAEDARWHVINFGLGQMNKRIDISIAEDSQLTSIFEPLRPHAFAGQETIEIKRLDDWLKERDIELSKTCLKLDVQGYEYEVLEGVSELLPHFAAVISELAVAKSYDGQPYMEDLVAFLRERGFDLWATRRGTWTPHGKREIECDGLFRNRRL